MTIGDNIKKYRKLNKLTQKELGELINKSTISIRKYEANNIIPSLKVLNDIAQALRIEPNLLVSDDMKGLAQSYLYNMSDDELRTYINRKDFKHELDNQIPLYDKLDPREMELIYLSEINNLKSIIESQNNLIESLKEMVEYQKNMIKYILDGDTDGK